MKHDIVLAGVGGQGILTIARALSIAAVNKGLHVKQAEIHGLSQRGGSVTSHWRASTSPIYSDVIPKGRADMVLGVEPMEALRYTTSLRPGGAVVSSTNALVNIGNYPQIETVLDHIAQFPNHVCLDMERLGRAAGSPLAANSVALGAASGFLCFTADELEQALATLFAAKGERIVEANIRALRFGRAAARAYREALSRGSSARTARGWIESLSTEHLAHEEDLDFTSLPQDAPGHLSGAEAHAFESLLMGAYDEGRRQLYEHEVYSLIELVGAISPPMHVFVPKGSALSAEALEQFPGDRVVVKIVAPDIAHKSDVKGVAFVAKSLDGVNAEIDRMVARHVATGQVAGTLVVEYVEHRADLGNELFVGIRSTREFGPVIAAGLGGLDTEALAKRMAPGTAVAKAVAMDTDAEEFLDLFKSTFAYEILSGQARGHDRVVSDGELLNCFTAFVSIARRFCVDRGIQGPDIGELEVNPFAFRGDKLVPLDGRGSLRPAAHARNPRPRPAIKSLLAPQSVAVVGVSERPGSLGQIVLGNILKAGFDPEQVTVIKKGDRLAALERPVDLLVATVPADALPDVVAESASSGKVRSAVLVSGGAGETEASHALGDTLKTAVAEVRSSSADGPVFLGPNCMGVRSVSSGLDTFFIPGDKLRPRSGRAPRPLALVSQSGAFVVSRLSALDYLDPAVAVSIGNQIDVTLSDVLLALVDRDDVAVVGTYLEGFADLDGLETLRAIESLRKAGKSVVFTKAGRTDKGREAAAGHTTAVAGDYDICATAVRRAGAIVAEGFEEFSELLELATLLVDRPCQGTKVFAVTNAGMEAVGVSDAMEPPATLSDVSSALSGQLRRLLDDHGLEKLVNVSNPLDVTPMADESVYDAVVRAALASADSDAVIVSCVPLAPALKTVGEALGDPVAFPALAQDWLSSSSKPIVFVVDAGPLFSPLVDALRASGLPVMRSADTAAKRLSQWMRGAGE